MDSDKGHGSADALARRLDRPMGVLGLIFLLVVLAQLFASGPRLAGALSAVAWVLWVVFVAELGLRAYVSDDRAAFWRRNWWQALFLLVPFLRFLRLARPLRSLRLLRLLPRATSVVSAGVRGSRSAGRLLSSRIGWLASVTVVVVLASSQLLYLAGSYDGYGQALHDAALATVTGEPLPAEDAFAQVLEVLLAVYSVAVFATLAAAVGAFFLESRHADGQGRRAG
jgi:voltage-gated potassium channel